MPMPERNLRVAFDVGVSECGIGCSSLDFMSSRPRNLTRIAISRHAEGARTHFGPSGVASKPLTFSCDAVLEGKLGLRRGARRVDQGRVRVEPEVRQDCYDYWSLCDQRDQSAMGATLSTEQDVQTKDAAH